MLVVVSVYILMTLGSFWGALWVVLGFKWCQILCWVCLVLATRYFSLNTSKTNRISWFLPFPWACKTFQNRSNLRFRLRFWYDFGTILVPKCLPLGVLGTSWGRLGASWEHLGGSRERLWGVTGAPKGSFYPTGCEGGCS